LFLDEELRSDLKPIIAETVKIYPIRRFNGRISCLLNNDV
jgi:hypothetical protein